MEIQAQMQKEFKIVARKKLYFSLGLMYAQCHDQFSELTMALKVTTDAKHSECDCGECANVANKILPTLMERHILALRPLLCMVQAIEVYRQAMGEYPEFARFLVKDNSEAGIDSLIQKTKAMADETQVIYSTIGKKANVKAPNFASTAFGDSFIRACEAVKLKGEK